MDLRKLQKSMSYCLPQLQAVQFASELANGLAYIHKCSVIHRDLKPSNVVLCWSPFAIGKLVSTIVDFGCSRLQMSRTLQSVGFCTAWYRAPEVFEAVTLGVGGSAPAGVGGSAPAGVGGSAPAGVAGRAAQELFGADVANRYGPSADVWSLGCVLGEFLHGRILFQTSGSFEVGILGTIAARIGPPPEAVLHVAGWPSEKLASAAKAKHGLN